MTSEEQVRKIARLACLYLDDSEVRPFTQELSSIFEYVKRLEKVGVEEIEPMSHVHGTINVFRADTVEPSMPVEQALQNTPDRSGRFIRVPIIIEAGSEHS